MWNGFTIFLAILAGIAVTTVPLMVLGERLEKPWLRKAAGMLLCVELLAVGLASCQRSGPNGVAPYEYDDIRGR
jgi:hypothetical protein